VKRVIAVSQNAVPIRKLDLYENLHEVCCESLSIFDDYPSNYLKWLEKVIKLKNTFGSKSINNYFHVYHPNISTSIPVECISLIYKTFIESSPVILEKYSKNFHFTDYRF
jgi:hypothetical protein